MKLKQSLAPFSCFQWNTFSCFSPVSGEWLKIVYGKSHGYKNADESLIHKRRHFDGCFLFHFLFEKGRGPISLHFPLSSYPSSFPFFLPFSSSPIPSNSSSLFFISIASRRFCPISCIFRRCFALRLSPNNPSSTSPFRTAS